MEAIAFRLEATALRLAGWRPSLLDSSIPVSAGWNPSVLKVAEPPKGFALALSFLSPRS